MKRFFRGALALFVVVTTLFASSAILASSTETPEEVLAKIVKDGKIHKYEETADDGATVTSSYVYAASKNIRSYYNSETGYISINGTDYKLQITDSNGNKVAGPSKLKLDAKGNYILTTTGMPEGKDTYTYSLVDDSGTVFASISEENDISSTKTIRVKLSESSEDEGWLVSTIKRLITELICAITLPAGDSYLHMISVAIGEPVTIDRIVYGDINKISIDFFESGDSAAEATSKPIKDILKPTINTWYSKFRNLALVFYMAVLVYFGIKILLTSTANRKAIYKRILTAWVMGITMLMCFPYVMKYAIKLNTAFCKALQSKDGSPKMESSEVTTSLKSAQSLYGTDGFVMLMLGKTDINESTKEAFTKTAVNTGEFAGNTMMYIRYVADHAKNIPLVVVYFIMIGEVLALLIMYYKRVFMLAFLITIFPIVAAFYPFSKTGDIKINTFGVWFKEFLVNVFVQSFHAATYVVVVSAGVSSYVEDIASGNWLFMIICILFLFEGEKIIRGIFNAKSSINSIGDIAASGMLAMNLAKNATTFMPKIPSRAKPKDGNANKKAAADRPALAQPAGSTQGAQANTEAVSAITTGNGAGSNAVVNNAVTLGRQAGATVTSANQSFNSNFESSSSKKGVWANRAASVVGGSANILSQGIGTVNGFAMGMAQNDGKGPSGLEKGISGAIYGKQQGETIGRGISNIVTGTVGRATAIGAGHALANEYMAGEHDDEIFTDADKQMDDLKKEALRKAYAKAARSKGRGFDSKAEIKIIKERIDQARN